MNYLKNAANQEKLIKIQWLLKEFVHLVICFSSAIDIRQESDLGINKELVIFMADCDSKVACQSFIRGFNTQYNKELTIFQKNQLMKLMNISIN